MMMGDDFTLRGLSKAEMARLSNSRVTQKLLSWMRPTARIMRLEVNDDANAGRTT